MYENEIRKCVNKIKKLNEVTDLFITYDMDRKCFKINDNEKLLKTFLKFSLIDFQNFLFELSKIDLWKNDYELDLKIIKY